MIDADNLGSFSRKSESSRAAVTHSFTRALARTNDDGDAIFKAHISILQRAKDDLTEGLTSQSTNRSTTA